MTEDTKPVPIECPQCSEPVMPYMDCCPACGLPFVDPEPATPRPAAMNTWPLTGPGSPELPPHAGVILQFLPSGTCVPLRLDASLTLGREDQPETADILDLSEFNASRHGVSREHCILRRRGAHLVVKDLGTTNGTMLNGERLEPHQEYVVAHGAKLILGTLHIIVAFNLI